MATSMSISTSFISGGVSSRRQLPSLSFRPTTVSVGRFRAVAMAEMAANEEGVKKNARQGKGIMKPWPISPELQELVGAPEMARTEVIKAIWAYIKSNNLQDPEKKRIIVCDDKLKKVFGGKDRVDFLEVSKLLNPHFIK
ncbi:SWIB/MDM2 domain superfamily protein [Rhynchospora pubera]|uniref:SWIB/MDM2 domain superfamily protein n=1 Tax=Rhynchospora pubera TaxID=906938 RepID=A0AAV8FBM5_9POAL|nr:SWIB/MDM2 domain superfamily protein [Rhynchospora pubera]